MRGEGVVVAVSDAVVLTTALSRVFFMRKELVFLLPLATRTTIIRYTRYTVLRQHTNERLT
jgi:hypothetical protein